MKRRVFCLSFLLFFLDCRSTNLLRLFSGNLPAMLFIFSVVLTKFSLILLKLVAKGLPICFNRSCWLIFLLNFSILRLFFELKKAPNKPLFLTSFGFAGSRDLTPAATILENSEKTAVNLLPVRVFWN